MIKCAAYDGKNKRKKTAQFNCELLAAAWCLEQRERGYKTLFRTGVKTMPKRYPKYLEVRA